MIDIFCVIFKDLSLVVFLNIANLCMFSFIFGTHFAPNSSKTRNL